MSYGIRVWDASGNLTLDTTDRLTRFVTSITPGTIAPQATVSYSVPGIVDDGTWFLVVINTWRPSSSAFYTDIYMYITSGFLNVQNINTSQTWSNGLGTRIEIFRG
jgi:hypothetical protein